MFQKIYIIVKIVLRLIGRFPRLLPLKINVQFLLKTHDLLNSLKSSQSRLRYSALFEYHYSRNDLYIIFYGGFWARGLEYEVFDVLPLIPLIPWATFFFNFWLQNCLVNACW